MGFRVPVPLARSLCIVCSLPQTAWHNKRWRATKANMASLCAYQGTLSLSIELSRDQDNVSYMRGLTKPTYLLPVLCTLGQHMTMYRIFMGSEKHHKRCLRTPLYNLRSILGIGPVWHHKRVGVQQSQHVLILCHQGSTLSSKELS
jgi:hypothetical protein